MDGELDLISHVYEINSMRYDTGNAYYKKKRAPEGAPNQAKCLIYQVEPGDPKTPSGSLTPNE